MGHHKVGAPSTFTVVIYRFKTSGKGGTATFVKMQSPRRWAVLCFPPGLIPGVNIPCQRFCFSLARANSL